MIERTHETGTFPRDPMIDSYHREQVLRRDVQRTLVNVAAQIRAVPSEGERGRDKDKELLRLVEGLLLRSINSTINGTDQ